MFGVQLMEGYGPFFFGMGFFVWKEVSDLGFGFWWCKGLKTWGQ